MLIKSRLTVKCEKCLVGRKNPAGALTCGCILYLVCVCVFFDGATDARVFLYRLSRKRDRQRSLHTSTCYSLATQRFAEAYGLMPYQGHKSKYLKRQYRGLCVMQLHNTQCGRGRKGYGATPSRGCHKESLPGGHMNTGCPSHRASIWVKKRRQGNWLYYTRTVYDGRN